MSLLSDAQWREYLSKEQLKEMAVLMLETGPRIG